MSLEDATYFDLCKRATGLGIDTGSRFPYIENAGARRQLIAEIVTAEAAEREQAREHKALRLRELYATLQPSMNSDDRLNGFQHDTETIKFRFLGSLYEIREAHREG